MIQYPPPTIAEAESALSAIPPTDREDWLYAAMALKAEFGDDALPIWDRWGQGADSYNERDAKAVFKSIDGTGGITIRWLFKRAINEGWQRSAAVDRKNGHHNGHDKPQVRPQAARRPEAKPKRPPFDFRAVWEAAEPAPDDHPYIHRKLGLSIGLRVYRGDLRYAGESIDGALLVPASDADGKLVTWQAILPSGKKLNAPGRPVAGWFTIQGNGKTAFVCEGIGQAWACHQATSSTAVCTFGFGNVEKVAVALKADRDLVLVADVGKQAAIEQLAVKLGCKWAAPPSDLGKNGDLNDLHARDGLQAVAEVLAQARTPDPAPADEIDGLVEVDLSDLAKRDPAPPVFIVPDFLPAGEVTLLAANGGTGKSQIELHLAVCLALQLDFYGIPVQQRNVDVLSFEDRQEVLHWRLHRTCHALGVRMSDLTGKLRLFDGTACMSSWFSRGQFGTTGPTAAFHETAERIGGVDRVVMIDGSSDTFAGNENDRSETKTFIRMLRRLIGPDGAVLLLAHVDKVAAKSGAESLGYSGSTGWNNGVRCRWYMYAEADEDGTETGNIVLEVRKSNLGRTGARMVLRFDEATGVFQRVDSEVVRRAPMFQESDEADAIVAVIRAAWQAGDPVPTAASGQRTTHSVCEARGGLPSTLTGRSGRRRFYRALEQLRAAGAVYVESFRRPNRHVSEVFNARD